MQTLLLGCLEGIQVTPSLRLSAWFLLSPYYPPELDHTLDASLTANEQCKHRTLVSKGNARQKLCSKSHPICTPTVYPPPQTLVNIPHWFETVCKASYKMYV